MLQARVARVSLRSPLAVSFTGKRLTRVLSPLAVRSLPRQPLQLRSYAQGPGGGMGGGGGGFPGFSGFKPQHQIGEALKEYVRCQHSVLLPVSKP